MRRLLAERNITQVIHRDVSQERQCRTARIALSRQHCILVVGDGDGEAVFCVGFLVLDISMTDMYYGDRRHTHSWSKALRLLFYLNMYGFLEITKTQNPKSIMNIGYICK